MIEIYYYVGEEALGIESQAVSVPRVGELLAIRHRSFRVVGVQRHYMQMAEPLDCRFSSPPITAAHVMVEVEEEERKR